MYFTRWYKFGARIVHAIYSSEYKNNAWTAPKRLNSNVNAEGANSIQPFVTADGKQLYFSSTKPGGEGGNDIWVSDLGADGEPVNSKNLGKSINTPANEQAPYYDYANKRLIYRLK